MKKLIISSVMIGLVVMAGIGQAMGASVTENEALQGTRLVMCEHGHSHYFIDANGDRICDNYNDQHHYFCDEDKNGSCDYCNHSIHSHLFVDEDGDEICDNYNHGLINGNKHELCDNTVKQKVGVHENSHHKNKHHKNKHE